MSDEFDKFLEKEKGKQFIVRYTDEQNQWIVTQFDKCITEADAEKVTKRFNQKFDQNRKTGPLTRQYGKVCGRTRHVPKFKKLQTMKGVKEVQ